MKKHEFRNTLIVASVAVIVLALSIFLCIKRANDDMIDYSFDELTQSTKQLAKQCYDELRNDKETLAAMAQILRSVDLENIEHVTGVINAYDFKHSYVTKVEVLRRDEKVITQSGEVIDFSDKVDFEEEAKKGSYTSDRKRDVLEPEKWAVYTAVPVVRDGETVAMVYGVVDLDKASDEYKIELYGGDAFVLITDGTTGEILLDTWHKELGNAYEMTDRERKHGFTLEDTMDSMKNGVSGDTAFVSKTINETVYLHYEPMNINNWSLTLGVREEKALESTRCVIDSIYLMAVIIALVLLLYMIFALSVLIRAYRTVYKMGVFDQVTGIENRNSCEKFVDKVKDKMFNSALCVYVDANGLHEINNFFGHNAGDELLKTVGESLEKQFKRGKAYRIGGDEFVVLSEVYTKEEAESVMEKVLEDVQKHGYSISYGIAYRTDEMGFDRVMDEADNLMLENKREYYKTNERKSR